MPENRYIVTSADAAPRFASLLRRIDDARLASRRDLASWCGGKNEGQIANWINHHQEAGVGVLMALIVNLPTERKDIRQMIVATLGLDVEADALSDDAALAITLSLILSDLSQLIRLQADLDRMVDVHGGSQSACDVHNTLLDWAQSAKSQMQTYIATLIARRNKQPGRKRARPLRLEEND